MRVITWIIQDTHCDYLPRLVMLVQHWVIYNAFLYLLEVQIYPWGLSLLSRILWSSRSMATLASIRSLTTLPKNLLLMRGWCDSALNLCLISSRTNKILPELIRGSVTAEHSLMKFGSIISAIIIFSYYRAIVTIARLWSRILSRRINCSLIQ